MKKLAFWALSIFLILSLVSCGSKKPAEDTTEPETSSENTETQEAGEDTPTPTPKAKDTDKPEATATPKPTAAPTKAGYVFAGWKGYQGTARNMTEKLYPAN